MYEKKILSGLVLLALGACDGKPGVSVLDEDVPTAGAEVGFISDSVDQTNDAGSTNVSSSTTEASGDTAAEVAAGDCTDLQIDYWNSNTWGIEDPKNGTQPVSRTLDEWQWNGWSWSWSEDKSTCVNVSGKPLSLAGLGEKIFNDESLSSPMGQSCASCHSFSAALTDPRAKDPTSLGANGADFGTRNSPTLFYSSHIPERQIVSRPNPLTLEPVDVVFGGFFIDGRSLTLEEQAKEPFFNPVEMNLSSPHQLAERIQGSDYAKEFQSRFGATVFEDAELTLESAVAAIAAFERTRVFSPFTSKFDLVEAGLEKFNASETRGQEIFNGKGACNLCHLSPEGTPETFSDYLYHSTGTPGNDMLLSNIGDWKFVDRGLGAQTGVALNDGQFRTPTLRNVALTAPYMHNGVFGTLREVVEFYNKHEFTAEVPGQNIPAFIGNLDLTEQEVDDLIAYLETFTDR